MPSGTYVWSQTAATNATADSAIGWSEGMAPSAVNDSARAMMSVLKKHDDDICGVLVTGGTSTSYTLTTNTVFASLATMSGQLVGFSPHATNGATVVLNVDGLGAKPLQSSPGVELPAGSLIEGTPYFALYDNSDQAWYLAGGVGAPNAYSIPLGCGMDYWGSTAPSSIFALAQGQAISRTTYSTLFTLFGTTYGVGDGTTTFNIPDKTGRVSAMKEASATRLTSTHFGGDSTALGAVGGLESHTLTTAQLAVHSHGVTDPGHVHNEKASQSGGANTFLVNALGSGVLIGTNVDTASAVTSISINNAGSGSAHNNVPPTIICNYIIRVL